MKITIETPVKAFISGHSALERHELVKLLSYVNKSAAYLVKRHANNHFWRSRNTVSWEARYEELKAAVNTTLLFSEDGREYIRPGSIPYLAGHFDFEIENKIQYPTPKKIAWAKPLPFELYPYQKAGVEKLLAEKHGNVSFATGTGKTACILQIAKNLGLKTVVVTPSSSIFHEMLEKFEYHFGKEKVGAFGDGKKSLGKQFTVAISKSLSNVREGSDEFDLLKKTEVFLGDECHTLPAETLESVCHGLFEDVPYRFFFSGTPTRGDGTEKLLNSIIGKEVHSIGAAEAVAGGYICPHEYRIVSVPSSNPNFQSGDALEMKRVHLLNNRNVLSFSAKLANAEAKLNKKQTLILVEELSQVAVLASMMTVPFAIAHSESNKTRLAELGIKKVKPNESVEMFNRGEVMVLIGTSCISTGTNIYNVHHCINIQGGTSETKTKQGSIGRATRFSKSNPYTHDLPHKTKAIIWDFDVEGIQVLRRHLGERVKFYEESGSEIKYIRL